MQPLQSSRIVSQRTLLIGLFLCVAVLAAMPIYDFDIFWHLANGRAMLAQGRIIQEEIFSYTSPGVPFENNEWLSQIILYGIYRLSGSFGLISFTILITLATLNLIRRSVAATVPDSGGVTAFFCFAAVAAGITRYMPRPHLFSFLGIGVILWLLSRWRSEDRPSPYLPIVLVLVILVWNSLHGAIYGLILLFAHLLAALVVNLNIGSRYFADPPLPRKAVTGLALATFGAVVISISTPVGFNLLTIFKTMIIGQTMAQFTSEFTPPRFSLLFAGYWGLLALTGIYLLRDLLRRKVRLAQTLILLGFGLLSLRYMRAIAPFLLVAIPYLSASTAELFRSRANALSSDNRAAKSLRIASLALAILITLAIKSGWLLGPTFRFGTTLDTAPDSLYPIGATNFVNASSLSGNLYNSSRFGGYLAYFLAAQRPIFHYNHTTLFPDIYKLSHNPEALRSLNINYAIVGDPIETQYTFKPPEWVPVYWEKNDLVLVRNRPENRAVIDRFQIFFFTPEITESQVVEMAQNPDIATKLAMEMGTYLSFRPDARIANLFARLILEPKLRFAPAARLSWINAALGPNENNATLKRSLAVLAGDQ